MSTQAAISFKNVNFAYNAVTILEHVTVEIEKQAFVCLIGPNGGGKTTLLRLILGLLKPISGTINILGLAPKKASKKIGYMPQYTNFDPHFPVSVMDVVLMGRLGIHRFDKYSKKDINIVLETLHKVNLVDIKKQDFSSLSGGQKQRVLIARAIVSEPELLLLDEPTAYIDPAEENHFYQILNTLNKQMTILAVSHDLTFVSKLFKEVLCVNKTVSKHSTSELDEHIITDLYNKNVRFIQHGRPCVIGEDK